MPDGAGGAGVEQIKRYIDIALDTRLQAMERRLMAAMNGWPTDDLNASATAPHLSRQQFMASQRMGGCAAPNAGLNPAMAPYLQVLKEEGEGGEEGETAREQREADAAAERKHQQEVKQREKFMAKYSGKEIFGEKDTRNSTTKLAKVPVKSCYQRARDDGLIIDPQGTFRHSWDVISVFLICWIAIFLPFRLAFEINDPGVAFFFNLVDLLIDIYFIVDVFLNTITAYVDDGHYIKDHKQIVIHYAKTWMGFDLISSFPIDWLVIFPPPLWPPDDDATGADGGAADFTQLVRVVRVVKLLRLLRIARLFRYLNRFEEASSMFGSFSANFVRLFKLVAFMNGCFQFLVAQLDSPPYNGTAWPADYPDGFHEDSWVVRLGIATSDSFSQWEWSFFTAICQMLALSIGVVPPRRSVELWSYMLSIMFGAVLYAIFVAVLTAVVADLDTSARAYRSHIDQLNQYMHHSELPRELRAKLRTYFQLCYPSKRLFDENSILDEISRPLQQEVCLHKCRSVLAALQLLDGEGNQRSAGDKGLPGAISQELQRVVFVTGDYIIREGEETEGLFFVSQGVVELFKSSSGEQILTTLGAGALFGEMALLSQSGRAVASVRVKTFCEGYHLSKQSYNKLIIVYPSFKEYLESVARLRLEKTAKKVGIKSDDLQGMLANAEGKKPARESVVKGGHSHKAADKRVKLLMNQLNSAQTSSASSTGYLQDRAQLGYEMPAIPESVGRSCMRRLSAAGGERCSRGEAGSANNRRAIGGSTPMRKMTAFFKKPPSIEELEEPDADLDPETAASLFGVQHPAPAQAQLSSCEA